MIAVAENKYGKSRVRLVQVKRKAGWHELREWTVEILFQGDFDSCFVEGDNSKILPTDTMKNTVYSLARDSARRVHGGVRQEDDRVSSPPQSPGVSRRGFNIGESVGASSNGRQASSHNIRSVECRDPNNQSDANSGERFFRECGI